MDSVPPCGQGAPLAEQGQGEEATPTHTKAQNLKSRVFPSWLGPCFVVEFSLFIWGYHVLEQSFHFRYPCV
eukprot:5613235-Amphidinium_carterae.1